MWDPSKRGKNSGEGGWGIKEVTFCAQAMTLYCPGAKYTQDVLTFDLDRDWPVAQKVSLQGMPPHMPVPPPEFVAKRRVVSWGECGRKKEPGLL